MLKLHPLKQHSIPWIEKYGCKCEPDPNKADFIIYEETGDPLHEIIQIKKVYNKFLNKLVFILSGDVDVSDDVCLWFCSTIEQNQRNKFQIYITNPRVYKTYPSFSYPKTQHGYFGGTLWDTPERNCLKQLPSKWVVEECNNYWNLPQKTREEITYRSYSQMRKSSILH